MLLRQAAYAHAHLRVDAAAPHRPKRSSSRSSNTVRIGLTVRYLATLGHARATSTPSRRCSTHADGDGIASLVLGDLVGYGAEPNAVIDTRPRARSARRVIRGNHDKAACGLDDGSSVQPGGATRGALDRSVADAGEPRIPARAADGARRRSTTLIEICHGAPFDEDHYIFDGNDALRGLEAASRPLCLFGHTHLPVMFWVKNKSFEGAAPSGPETILVARRGSAVPGESGLGRPAARRRPARGLRHPDDERVES